MRRFQTKEEIDLDDEDIEFIVQQVGLVISVSSFLNCSSKNSGLVTDNAIFMSPYVDVEDTVRRVSSENWWACPTDPYSVVPRPASSPV